MGVYIVTTRDSVQYIKEFVECINDCVEDTQGYGEWIQGILECNSDYAENKKECVDCIKNSVASTMYSVESTKGFLE